MHTMPWVESYHLEDHGTIDKVTMSFAGNAGEVIKITLEGDVDYGAEKVPQAVDFLKDFAAILGYEVHEVTVEPSDLW